VEKIHRYYVKGKVLGGFSIPIFDDKGKKIQIHKNGSPLYRTNGAPVYRSRALMFEEELSDVKGNTRCMIKTCVPAEIKHLNELAEDKSNGVMTEDQRKESENKSAFKLEKENVLLKDENVSLLEENATLKEKLAGKK